MLTGILSTISGAFYLGRMLKEWGDRKSKHPPFLDEFFASILLIIFGLLIMASAKYLVEDFLNIWR